MLPDRVSNPGPLTYESGVLPIALRGPANKCDTVLLCIQGSVRYAKPLFISWVNYFPPTCRLNLIDPFFRLEGIHPCFPLFV